MEEKNLEKEYLAGWKRARADLLNYKKEEMERIGGLVEYAHAEFLLKLLPILDNLERAEKTIQDPGFLQIAKQFRDFLKRQGVAELNPAAGKEKFNPEVHEAVGEAEETNLEPGTITEVVEKGYTLNKKLLKPAKVKLAK